MKAAVYAIVATALFATPGLASPPESSCRVGRSVYRLVLKGMAHSDVIKALGCDGVRVSTKRPIYKWSGKTAAAYVTIVFDADDRVEGLGGFLPPLPGDEQ
jgi:hypothetical protein